MIRIPPFTGRRRLAAASSDKVIPMRNRGAELLLVGVLLVACGGVVFFVFATMQVRRTHGFGSASASDPRADLPRSAPVPAVGEPAPATPREPRERVEVEEEQPPADEPAQPKKQDPPAPEEAREYAELTLELLDPKEEEERTITVTVRDERGDPIDEALVVFREGLQLIYRERTDAAGEALFVPADFETGPFRIDAIAEGFAPAHAPAVKPGARPELILKAKPLIEGVVKAPSTGHGLVKLFTREAVLTTKIAADGTFVFPDLEEGYYTVQAEVQPYGSDSETIYLQGGTRRFVTLRVSTKNQLRIFGTIKNWQPDGKAWVNGIELSVLHTGSYEFKQAVFGVNEILVDVPGKALLRERFSVSGRQNSRYDVSLRREGRVRGRVRSAATRKPIPGAEVRTGVEFQNFRNRGRVPLFPIAMVPVVKTDEDGRFEIGRLDKRLSYVFSVVAEGYGQGLVEGVMPQGFRGIDLPEGPYLFGKLRGLGGVPHDAVVTARRLQDHPDGRAFNVKNYDGARSVRNRRGFYGLSGMLPGLYLIRVSAERYGSVETVLDLTEGARWRVDLRMRRNADIEDRDAHLLRRLPPVVDAEDAPDPRQLPPALTTNLKIDVRRPETEVPLPGVRVSFWENDEEISPRLEFADSEFELVGLPEGKYRAVLTHGTLKKPLVKEGFLIRRGYSNVLTLR